MPAKGDRPSSRSAASELTTETHHALSAWFLGPKAENRQVMKDTLSEIVDRIARARTEYFPEDPVGRTVTGYRHCVH